MNVFQRVKEVHRLLQPIQLEPGQTLELIRQAAKWHYNKRKFQLSKEAAKVYEVLIKNSYNPDTVYKWFLLLKSPTEVKDSLRVGRISQRAAFQKKAIAKEELMDSDRELLHDIIDSFQRYMIR